MINLVSFTLGARSLLALDNPS